MKEYKRTCEDELDWVVVDQLHKATLQMSNNCFEFKKICVGLIGAVLAILVKLNDNQLTHSYFFIPLTFAPTPPPRLPSHTRQYTQVTSTPFHH